jgi:hypothetical protein
MFLKIVVSRIGQRAKKEEEAFQEVNMLKCKMLLGENLAYTLYLSHSHTFSLTHTHT